MKNTIKTIFFSMLFFLSMLNGQMMKEVYTSPNFDNLSKNHKTIAILPFTVVLGGKALQEMGEEMGDVAQLPMQLQNEGKLFQQSIYSRFLKKSKNYTISFQDIDRTNGLLKKAGITYEDLEWADMNEIASILRVDAVIAGNVYREKGMKQGGAVAMAILVGGYGATGSAKLNIKIFNGEDGSKIWQYTHRAKGGLGTNVDDIVLKLMKQVSRKFPYRKTSNNSSSNW
ncbi:MAG: hypothetical protein HN573_04685 [Candidatus Marinimicrobia bacterium]|nr:hypothetical protein [Candidatus Neomarinimicrobiota bacterium]